MAEYFRAAANCDIDSARLAPLLVDTVDVRRGQFLHERLVEQALQTQLLLHGLGGFPGIVRTAGAVAPAYVRPGGVDTAVDPALRKKGPHTLHRELVARVAGVEAATQRVLADVLAAEAEERARREQRWSSRPRSTRAAPPPPTRSPSGATRPLRRRRRRPVAAMRSTTRERRAGAAAAA